MNIKYYDSVFAFSLIMMEEICMKKKTDNSWETWSNSNSNSNSTQITSPQFYFTGTDPI